MFAPGHVQSLARREEAAAWPPLTGAPTINLSSPSVCVCGVSLSHTHTLSPSSCPMQCGNFNLSEWTACDVSPPRTFFFPCCWRRCFFCFKKKKLDYFFFPSASSSSSAEWVLVLISSAFSSLQHTHTHPPTHNFFATGGSCTKTSDYLQQEVIGKGGGGLETKRTERGLQSLPLCTRLIARPTTKKDLLPLTKQ